MRAMSEYYKVIHFLEYDSLDKCYPCQDYFYNVSRDEEIIQTQAPYLYLTNRSSFSKVEYVDVIVKCSQSFSTKDVKFTFSILKDGKIPSMVLDVETVETINPNTLVRLRFPIKKSQTMANSAQHLTGIQSVQLLTPNNNFSIYDIIFCNDTANYSLEELDQFIENGKNYVSSRLSMVVDEIPLELKDYVYTASAGYAWLSTWEFEARIMNDEQKNAKSYGKWLFSVVDDAIADYMEKIEYKKNVDYVQDGLVGFEWLRW